MYHKILGRRIFLASKKSEENLLDVAKFLGTEGLWKLVEKYNLKKQYIKKALQVDGKWLQFQSRNLDEFVTPENSRLCTKEALDLLSQIFVWDKNARISAEEAMNHEYFDPVRAMAQHYVPSRSEPTCQSWLKPRRVS